MSIDPRILEAEHVNGAVDLAPVPTGDLFRRYTAAEMATMDLSFAWLVRRLLVMPTYGMVAGSMKTLKTYIGMMTWVGVAAGIPILDVFKPDTARPVVAYIGEGGRVPSVRRLHRVCAAMGVRLADLPLEATWDVAPIQSAKFVESLDRDLRELQPALVGIDPLYAYHGTQVKASDLHQEGALLSGISARCGDAGASLLIVNHFNQTGTGSGLQRITQAGGGEWSDSWLLLSHRENPHVEAGEFRLLLEVGSRQWGGASWDIDMSIGRFDPDLGEHVGDIAWAVRPHAAANDSDKAKRDRELEEDICEVLADQPWELTKTAVRDVLKVGAGRFNETWQRLVEGELIHHADLPGIEGRTPKKRPRWALAHEPVPLAADGLRRETTR